MPANLSRAVEVAVSLAGSGLLLWWPRYRPGTRRSLALACSAAGLAFLVAALNSHGQRETEATAVYLMGTPLVTGSVAASASLPYYVATAACLLLGTAGLAASDTLAERLRRRWVATAVLFSFFLTAVRFLLETAAAPATWTRLVGITWLAPVVGAWFLVHLREEGGGLGRLARLLLGYGVAVRSGVAALMALATSLRLGSHYDITPFTRIRSPFDDVIHEFVGGSFWQFVNIALVPQLLVWPLYTLVAGLLGAAVARLGLERGGAPWARDQVLSRP